MGFTAPALWAAPAPPFWAEPATDPNAMNVGRFQLASPLVLAPMCGVTDLPMRRLARREGAALCFTQMVSAEALVRGSERTEELLHTAPDDVPLGVQIFGGHPEVLAEAARRLCDRFAVRWIDLNMGCPVRKVACKAAGSGLLQDLPLVERIWRTLRRALPNENFSVKVRSGWDATSIVVDELAALAEGCGLDAIALHPRTRKQGYSGEADWSLIARLKERCRHVRVFGSGDLLTPGDVKEMLSRTGADGAFLARGATGNPWIFSRALALLEGRADPGPPAPEALLSTILAHLGEMCDLYSPTRALKHMRPHLSGYLRGLPRAAEMRRTMFALDTPEALGGRLREFLLPRSPTPCRRVA